MNNDKVIAAQNCIKTLLDDLDWEIWLSDHPNETNALDRILDDLEEPERWDGMS